MFSKKKQNCLNYLQQFTLYYLTFFLDNGLWFCFIFAIFFKIYYFIKCFIF